MNREELAQYVSYLRQLRTTPPTLSKALREDPEVEPEEVNSPKAVRGAKSSVDILALLSQSKPTTP